MTLVTLFAREFNSVFNLLEEVHFVSTFFFFQLFGNDVTIFLHALISLEILASTLVAFVTAKFRL